MKKLILVLVVMFSLVFAGSAYAITLEWDAPVVDATHGAPDGYIVYYGTASNKVEFNERTLTTTHSIADNKFQLGVEYFFTVVAYNAQGPSNPSDEVSDVVVEAYTPPPENPAPVIINIAPGSPVTINIGN